MLPRGPLREGLYKRLGQVLGIGWRAIRATVDDVGVAPLGFAPTAITYISSDRELAYLSERKRSYPGVIERSVPVRSYPQRDIGSVLLGQVGEITGGELGKAAFNGVSAGSIVGQSGLESQYQPYLQGVPGQDKVEINSSGYPTGAKGAPIAPTAGDQLGTSLSLGLEREGYIAMRQAMSAARAIHNPATAASFVAMNPMTGRIYGLGSIPTYDANAFATGVSTSAYRRILDSGSLNDRAVNGLYPIGLNVEPVG